MAMLNNQRVIMPDKYTQPITVEMSPIGFLSQGDVCRDFSQLASANLTVCYWTWPIETIDLPIKNGDFP